MFGKYIKFVWPSVLLIAIFAKIIILFLNDQLGFYSHPRYFNFALIMSLIGIAIILAGLFYSIKTKILKPTTFKALDLYVLVIVVTLFAFAPAPLSVQNTERRNVVTQEASISSSEVEKSFDCPERDVRYTNIEFWVYNVNNFAASCFDGLNFESEGYFFDDNTGVLPSEYAYFGRIVISCCVVDARPYALPIVTNGKEYDKKQLYSVNGTLEIREINGVDLFVINPYIIEPKQDNPIPYEFRGVSDYKEVETVEQVEIN